MSSALGIIARHPGHKLRIKDFRDLGKR